MIMMIHASCMRTLSSIWGCNSLPGYQPDGTLEPLRPHWSAVTTRASPTVRRRRLGLELRRLREAAGVTIDVVADRLECSSSKISRIETGHTGATPGDVRDMLAVYGVDGTAADELVQVAREARQKGWWHLYGTVLTTAYVGLEAAASEIHAYEGQVVPGLLQVDDYARAMIVKGRPDISPVELDRRGHRRRGGPTRLTQG